MDGSKRLAGFQERFKAILPTLKKALSEFNQSRNELVKYGFHRQSNSIDDLIEVAQIIGIDPMTATAGEVVHDATIWAKRELVKARIHHLAASESPGTGEGRQGNKGGRPRARATEAIIKAYQHGASDRQSVATRASRICGDTVSVNTVSKVKAKYPDECRPKHKK